MDLYFSVDEWMLDQQRQGNFRVNTIIAIKAVTNGVAGTTTDEQRMLYELQTGGQKAWYKWTNGDYDEALRLYLGQDLFRFFPSLYTGGTLKRLEFAPPR